MSKGRSRIAIFAGLHIWLLIIVARAVDAISALMVVLLTIGVRLKSGLVTECVAVTSALDGVAGGGDRCGFPFAIRGSPAGSQLLCLITCVVLATNFGTIGASIAQRAIGAPFDACFGVTPRIRLEL